MQWWKSLTPLAIVGVLLVAYVNLPDRLTVTID